MERPQPSATGKADRSVVGPVHAVHLQPRVERRDGEELPFRFCCKGSLR